MSESILQVTCHSADSIHLEVSMGGVHQDSGATELGAWPCGEVGLVDCAAWQASHQHDLQTCSINSTHMHTHIRTHLSHTHDSYAEVSMNFTISMHAGMRTSFAFLPGMFPPLLLAA